MFAGDPYTTFENHEKVIRRLVGNRNPAETYTLNETRRSIHSVSGKVVKYESSASDRHGEPAPHDWAKGDVATAESQL